MAAGPVVVYDQAILRLGQAQLDLDLHNVVAVLLLATYTPSASTHVAWSDLSAYQVTGAGNGYTAGGQLISPLTVTLVAGIVQVDSPIDPRWTNTNLTTKYLVGVKRAGATLVAGDLPIFYVDLSVGGGSVTTVNAALEVSWHVNGIFTIARV